VSLSRSLPRWGRCLALPLLLLGGGALPADPPDPPAPFEAHYQVSRNGFGIGEARVSLHDEGAGRYTYETRTGPTGLLALLRRGSEVHERSSWVIHGEHLRPLEYEYHQRLGSRRRDVRLTFDWAHNTVRNDIGGDVWTMEVPEGTLDKLLVQLAVMVDLQDGPAELEYQVADGGMLKTYQFSVTGTETLETPIGTFETTRVERVHSEQARTTVLWCAPELNFLPVRVEQREKDGARFRMSIERLNGLSG
jgi:hypothetical protein